MNAIVSVTNEIERSLPCFGLRVSRHEAHCLAAIYVRQRPSKPSGDLIEIMLTLPELIWDSNDTLGIKVIVMQSLIEHLDGLYLVDTFEHDYKPGASNGQTR